MELSEGLMGLLGVAGLISSIVVWCWLEKRVERKRAQQRDVYDKWMREQAKEQ
jgi:hypothetical protein